MEHQYQVVIVGGGPVGVALGVDLGQRGVSCVVIERHTELPRIPKGQSLTQRTLEHFYFWNCVDELRSARLLPPGYPIGGVTAYGNLASDYWFVQGSARNITQDYYFQKNERLPQYQTEKVLRERAAQLPNVKLMTGMTVKSFQQDDSGVSVVAESAIWPYEEQTITGDYLVGCDGTRSMIREGLGIGRAGPSYDQKMLLAVFKSKELHEHFKRFPERTTYRAMKPELQGHWQFFGRVDVGEGFFFHAPVPRDTTTDNFDFLGLLHEAAGIKFDAEFDHLGFWELRVLVADEYSRGRCFIAGDAAHSHPPYGGFGLNSGLEDVANLGWKLASAVKGWGGQALLDSYTAERRPIFLETGEAMIAGGINRDNEWLQKHNPNTDKADFEAAWKEWEHRSNTERQFYEPHYEGSQVVLGPDGGKSSIHGNHTFVAQAGHHLPPQPLSNGRNVYEELGQDYALLAFGADKAAVEAFSAAAKAQNVPLKVIEDTREGGREKYEASLILVRPDQYAVWTANEAPADAAAILRKVTGN